MVVWKVPQMESYLVIKVKYYQVILFLMIVEVEWMDNMWGEELDHHPQ